MGYLLITVGLIFALPGWFDPDKRANQLFVEAAQLVQAAQKAEQESYGEAYKLYQHALEKVEAITARYSASQVAVRIIEGEAKLGPYTVTELKETIIPGPGRKRRRKEIR